MTKTPAHTDRPTALEQRLVELLLAGDPEPMPALREQWSRVRVASREFSQFGTDVTFALPPGEAPVWPWTQHYGDIQFRVTGSDEWRGGAIEIEDGYFQVLHYWVYELEVAAELPITEWTYTDYVEAEDDDGCEDAELIHVAERKWDGHHWWMNMMRERRERGEDGPHERPQGLRLV